MFFSCLSSAWHCQAGSPAFSFSFSGESTILLHPVRAQERLLMATAPDRDMDLLQSPPTCPIGIKLPLLALHWRQAKRIHTSFLPANKCAHCLNMTLYWTKRVLVYIYVTFFHKNTCAWHTLCSLPFSRVHNTLCSPPFRQPQHHICTNTGHISTAQSLFEEIPFPCLKTRAQAVSFSCFHGWSQPLRPICFLVLPTNRSRDLILPGKHPLIVRNGNWATPSFLPRETSANGRPVL